jgi:hypothetical protein
LVLISKSGHCILNLNLKSLNTYCFKYFNAHLFVFFTKIKHVNNCKAKIVF